MSRKIEKTGELNTFLGWTDRQWGEAFRFLGVVGPMTTYGYSMIKAEYERLR